MYSCYHLNGVSGCLCHMCRTSFVPKDKDMDKTGAKPDSASRKEAPLGFHSDTRHI